MIARRPFATINHPLLWNGFWIRMCVTKEQEFPSEYYLSTVGSQIIMVIGWGLLIDFSFVTLCQCHVDQWCEINISKNYYLFGFVYLKSARLALVNYLTFACKYIKRIEFNYCTIWTKRKLLTFTLEGPTLTPSRDTCYPDWVFRAFPLSLQANTWEHWLSFRFLSNSSNVSTISYYSKLNSSCNWFNVVR